MITTYLDKGCNALRNIQNLELNDGYSALWLRIEKGEDLREVLDFIICILDSFVGMFWFASPGGYGNPRILDIKRAFGSFSVSKNDVLIKNEIYDVDGKKLYSDIAKINLDNIESLAGICKRQLFGTDSVIFFLPSLNDLEFAKVLDSTLGELLIKRNAANQIDETLQNYRFIEAYIDEVISLDGVATIVMRDVNMCMSIVAVGNQFIINNLSQGIDNKCLNGIKHKSINESDFQKQSRVGVRMSALC